MNIRLRVSTNDMVTFRYFRTHKIQNHNCRLHSRP